MQKLENVKSAFQIIAKPIGPICNLDCTYCFYLEKKNIYPKKNNFRMPPDVLEKFIRQKIEEQDYHEIGFVWQGGEPTLLGVDYFHEIVRLQKKYSNGKKITNGFQTNGVLLDDQWCSFFAENDFLIGLSIDGPREIHDRYRVYKNGKPSFDKVLKGIEYLKKHQVDFNTLTVVQKDNSCYPIEIYHFLKEIGSGFMQFIPIVERVSQTTDNGVQLVLPDQRDNVTVSDWTVEAKQYGIFLCSIFDEWVKNDVGKYFVQIFDVALQMWAGLDSSLCVFRKTCGQVLAIEHNGDVYSCDHYVYPEYKLGNIIDQPLSSLVFSEEQRTFGQNKRDKLPGYCLNCEVRFACNGECPKHRFIKTPDGEDGLNYLCEGYKLFFSHIDPYMKYMTNELRYSRPPSNVMQWIRAQNSSRQITRLGRNEKCSCGSGKKYKNCCIGKI